jgi:hypothetical protein
MRAGRSPRPWRPLMGNFRVANVLPPSGVRTFKPDGPVMADTRRLKPICRVCNPRRQNIESMKPGLGPETVLPIRADCHVPRNRSSGCPAGSVWRTKPEPAWVHDAEHRTGTGWQEGIEYAPCVAIEEIGLDDRSTGQRGNISVTCRGGRRELPGPSGSTQWPGMERLRAPARYMADTRMIQFDQHGVPTYAGRRQPLRALESRKRKTLALPEQNEGRRAERLVSPSSCAPHRSQ